jgi:hypothetical protein
MQAFRGCTDVFAAFAGKTVLLEAHWQEDARLAVSVILIFNLPLARLSSRRLARHALPLAKGRIRSPRPGDLPGLWA